MLLAFCAMLTGCGEAAVLRIQLNWAAEPEFGGLFCAQQAGYFAAEGLAVELVQGGPQAPVAQLVATGKVAFGIIAAHQLIELHEQGGELLALYATFQHNPKAVMVHHDAPYQSLEELWRSSATVSCTAGMADFAWLDHQYPNGQRRVVPYAANLAQFAQDHSLAQQCYLTAEPVALALQGVNTRTFAIRDSGFDPYDALLVTRASWYAANQATCRAVVRAVTRGWREYLDAPDATNAHMCQLNQAMSQMAMQRAAQVQKALIETAATRQHGLGTMQAERWQQLLDQLRQLGRLQRPLAPERLFVSDQH